MNNNLDSKGIYIHIPFCKSKCKYCSFNSYSGKEDIVGDYVKALKIELIKKSNKNFGIDTIYFGGGTPSILKAEYIEDILSVIRKNYSVLEDVEISIEANPNTITKSKSDSWIRAGINRVSVGLQSHKDKILKELGRTHTFNDYMRAIEILKSSGFININTDLMIGLPHQNILDIKKSIRLVSKMGVKHISCYSLILEENTPLMKDFLNNKFKLPNENKAVAMYAFAVKYLNKFGFERYEVSNFCKMGYECKHNINCWHRKEYIGVGAGANGFENNCRYGNVLNPIEYINKISNKGNIEEFKESVLENEAYEETIMLGLRLSQGVSIRKINQDFNMDFVKEKSKQIEKLIKMNLIEITDDFVKLTDNGFYVLNSVILELV